MKYNKDKKKKSMRMAALAVALAIGMNAGMPGAVYATQTTDELADELTDGDQETVAAPGADAADSSSSSTGSSSSDSSSSSGSSSSSTGTSTTSTKKSSDSSLSHLGISPGTISPSFSSGVHEYTATVDANVTAISVAARPNDSKAVIASVSGAKSLKPGTNTVKVVVSAENLTTTTYTITVTCGSASDSTQTTTDSASDTDTETGSESADVTGEITGEITDIDAASDDTDAQTDETDSGSAVTFDTNGYLIYEGESYMPSSMMPAGEYVSLEKYNNLYEQSQSEKTKYVRLVVILAVALLISAIVLLNLALKLRDMGQDAKLGFDDLEPESIPDTSMDSISEPIPDLFMPESLKTKKEKSKKEHPKKENPKKENPRKEHTPRTHLMDADEELEILDLNDL